METQDNGFLLVIDGVRKEKERLTAAKLFFLSFNPMVLSRLPALVLEDNKHKEEEGKRAGEKEMNCEPFHRECFYVTGTHFFF